MSGYAWARQITLIQNPGLFLFLLDVYLHAKNHYDLSIEPGDPVKSLVGNNTKIKAVFPSLLLYAPILYSNTYKPIRQPVLDFFLKKKLQKKLYGPFFMDGVQLPQG